MREVMEWVWKFSDGKDMLCPAVRLKEMPEIFSQKLQNGGYLEPAGQLLRAIIVDDEVYEIADALYADGKTHHFYCCDGQTVEVPEDDLLIYKVTFKPFAKIIFDGLRCKGEITELIPGKLWQAGVAGQQRRAVYLVRRWSDDECRLYLAGNEVKKGAIVIYIGNCQNVEKFNENQIYALKDMLDFVAGEFVFDGECIYSNLADMVANRPKRNRNRQPRNSQESARIGVEKAIWTWFNVKLDAANTHFNDAWNDIPQTEKNILTKTFRTQKELAGILDIKEYELSRSVAEWKKEYCPYGRLFLDILKEIVVRSSTKALNDRGNIVEKLNGFYHSHRKEIDNLRKEF